MKIIGFIKEVDESPQIRFGKMGVIKETTYESFSYYFPHYGELKIAPYDDITNEILVLAEKTTLEKHKIVLEYTVLESKILRSTFFQRLKFLFTKKLG